MKLKTVVAACLIFFLISCAPTYNDSHCEYLITKKNKSGDLNNYFIQEVCGNGSAFFDSFWLSTKNQYEIGDELKFTKDDTKRH